MNWKLLLVIAVMGIVAGSFEPAPADAAKPRKLSETKARRFLAPLVSDIGNGIAADLKTEDPGVTLVDSRVGNCERKNRRRIDCDLNFTFRHQPDPDLTCSLRVAVK